MAAVSHASSLHTDFLQALSTGNFPRLRELYHVSNAAEQNAISAQCPALEESIREDLLVQAVQHNDPPFLLLHFLLRLPPFLNHPIPESVIRLALLSPSPVPYQTLFNFSPEIIRQSIYDGRETQVGKALSVPCTPARLESLLALGLRPSNDPFDFNPLAIACGRWQVESQQLCELLVQYGAVVAGSGALVSAAMSGRVELVRWILDQPGVKVDDVAATNLGPPNSKLPIQYAVERGHEEVVELLIARGADPGNIESSKKGGFAQAVKET